MACHHAQFLVKAIYYLIPDLLLSLIPAFAADLLSAMEVVIVKQMLELISVFYTTCFVKASFAGAAPCQDLQTIDDMIQYIEVLTLIKHASTQCRILSFI